MAVARGFATILSYKDEIRAIMARCLELDAAYFHSGPHRYFGAFYARVPAFAGGDLERSREHFDTALSVDPNYFDQRDGKVYSAEGYGAPVAVPTAPTVHHTYNYGWGMPSSRITPISRPAGR